VRPGDATSSSAEETVSFVIPTYDEPVFGESLDRLVDHLAGIAGTRFELLVVDDSDDAGIARMRAEVEARAARSPRVAVAFLEGPRLGKGAAVRQGVLASTGSVIFTLDADLPVPLASIERFLETMRETGADGVIGQRPGDRYADDAWRHFLSRGLYYLQTMIVFHRAAFEDTQCGFKAFRGEVLKDMARLQITDRGMHDLEYLYMATIRHLKLVSLPVEVCPEIRPSRIKLFRCLVVDPFDVLRIKARGVLGRYRWPS
jgi:dolichyl-phosphate beta-glucosyltransferase